MYFKYVEIEIIRKPEYKRKVPRTFYNLQTNFIIQIILFYCNMYYLKYHHIYCKYTSKLKILTNKLPGFKNKRKVLKICYTLQTNFII